MNLGETTNRTTRLTEGDITEWEVSGVSGSAYCKQQALVYHQFVYWRRKLDPTEDCPKQEQEQATTGLARVVSAPGAGIGGADCLTVALPGGVSIPGLHAKMSGDQASARL